MPNNVRFPDIDPIIEYPLMKTYRVYEMSVNWFNTKEIHNQLGIKESEINSILRIYESNTKIQQLRGRISDQDLSETLRIIHEHFPELLELDSIERYSEIMAEYPDWFYLLSAITDCLYFENRSNRVGSNISHLLISSPKAKDYGAPIVETLNQMKLPFEILLKHSSQRTKKELHNFEAFWRTELSLPDSKTIKLKRDGSKKKGPYDRIEIKVFKDNGQRNAAFYFSFIQLSAHFEAIHNLMEQEAEKARKKSPYY